MGNAMVYSQIIA